MQESVKRLLEVFVSGFFVCFCFFFLFFLGGYIFKLEFMVSVAHSIFVAQCAVFLIILISVKSFKVFNNRKLTSQVSARGENSCLVECGVLSLAVESLAESSAGHMNESK